MSHVIEQFLRHRLPGLNVRHWVASSHLMMSILSA